MRESRRGKEERSASGGTPARTERDEPAAEPSPQPDAPEDDSQDDDREGEQAQESEEPPAAESATTETPAPADVSADAEDVETGNVEGVLDGDIEIFLEAYVAQGGDGEESG